VKGGKDLIKYIREGRFDNQFLASCDAIALYPSVMVEEGLAYCRIKYTKMIPYNRKRTCPKKKFSSLQDCALKILIECEFGFFKQKEEHQWAGH